MTEVKRSLGNSIPTSGLWYLRMWPRYFYTICAWALYCLWGSDCCGGNKQISGCWAQKALFGDALTMTGSGRPLSWCSYKKSVRRKTSLMWSSWWDRSKKEKNIASPMMGNCYDINDKRWDLMWPQTVLTEMRAGLLQAMKHGTRPLMHPRTSSARVVEPNAAQLACAGDQIRIRMMKSTFPCSVYPPLGR